MIDIDDRFAIQNLYSLYAHLLDTGQAAKVPFEIFTEDAAVDYGGETPTVGRDALIRVFAGYPDLLEATSHNVTNIAIALRGDVADVLARVIGWHWNLATRAMGADRPADFVQIGAYADTLVRLSDGWRIAQRTVHGLAPGAFSLGVGSVPPRSRPPALPHLREATWPL